MQSLFYLSVPFHWSIFSWRWSVNRSTILLRRLGERFFYESRWQDSGKYCRALMLLNFQAVEKSFYVRVRRLPRHTCFGRMKHRQKRIELLSHVVGFTRAIRVSRGPQMKRA